MSEDYGVPMLQDELTGNLKSREGRKGEVFRSPRRSQGFVLAGKIVENGSALIRKLCLVCQKLPKHIVKMLNNEAKFS